MDCNAFIGSISWFVLYSSFSSIFFLSFVCFRCENKLFVQTGQHFIAPNKVHSIINSSSTPFRFVLLVLNQPKYNFEKCIDGVKISFYFLLFSLVFFVFFQLYYLFQVPHWLLKTQRFVHFCTLIFGYKTWQRRQASVFVKLTWEGSFAERAAS